jgi:protein phosphatase
MRLLILTDIHGNIDALDALDESYDRILFLGDLVDYGAAPEEVVRWMSKRAPVAVSGNHDLAMATGCDCRSSPLSYALSVATREHFRPRMSEESLLYLSSLPARSSFDAGGAPFHLVHATPRDPHFEYLAGDAPESTWQAAAGGLMRDGGWLLVGHSHRPFLRRIGSLAIVNPGSLGMPVDGDTRGCYAVWEDGQVELRRVRYDVERAVARVGESGLPEEIASRMSLVLRNASRSG